MDKQYVAPELQLAGDADEGVLGMVGGGIDMFGQDLGSGDPDFWPDEAGTEGQS